MTEINISMGSFPSEDPQANNPRLLNAFVNLDNEIELLPALKLKFAITNPKAVFRSTFNNRLFVVTNNDVFYIENDVLVEVGAIDNSSFAVRISENIRNELTIVNGIAAYVIDQSVSLSIITLGVTNNFTLSNPVDVVAINNIMVIVGGTDKKWVISDVNNALSYQDQIVETDRIMGELKGVAQLSNNLFIFGSGAVERWVPTTLRTPQDFPFVQDPSGRDEFGLASTAGLMSGKNEILYPSDLGQIRRIGSEGFRPINPPGIQRIIRSFSNLDKATGSYYYFKGLWHYQLSFSDSEDSFIYCSQTKKWCENSDLIRGSDISTSDVILSDGLYELTEDYTTSYKNVLLQTAFFPVVEKPLERKTLNQVYLDITQGKNETSEKQQVFLSLSKDNIAFGATIGRTLSPVGKRLAQLVWYMNVANGYFTIRFTGHFKSDITLKKCTAEFN